MNGMLENVRLVLACDKADNACDVSVYMRLCTESGAKFLLVSEESVSVCVRERRSA